MSEDEKKRLIKYAIDKTASRIKVIIGTGSNNTMSAIRMSQYAEEAGADGLLLVTPYYNKTTQEGLFVHYKAIADAVSIPIILYNVPSRTGVNILPETCQRLAQIENIVGIKRRVEIFRRWQRLLAYVAMIWLFIREMTTRLFQYFLWAVKE